MDHQIDTSLLLKNTSKIENVYVPQQWFDHVRQALISTEKRVEVTEMQQSDFKDFRTHLRKLYTERSKDVNDKPINFSDAVWFNFGKGEKFADGKLTEIDHSNVVWIRHSYDAKEEPLCASYHKKRKKCITDIDSAPPLLYNSYPVPIKEAKAKDITKLVTSYIPLQYQSFYSELPTAEEGDSDDEDM